VEENVDLLVVERAELEPFEMAVLQERRQGRRRLAACS
jgi:hypothetical protein